MMQQSINSRTATLDELDVDGPAAELFRQAFEPFNWAEEPLRAIFEKVERAKQEWEATADALPELICLIDDRGRVLRANRTVETWGLNPVVAVKGRDLHDLIHPDCARPFCYLKRFLQQHAEQADARPPAELEAYDFVLQRHLLVRVQPMPVHERLASSAAVVVVQDISERKQAENALRRHTQRVEVMNEIGEAILAACSPDAIAQAALSRLRHLVSFSQARVTLWKTESDQCLVLAAYANGQTHLRPGKSFPKDTFRSSEERRPDKHFVIEDLSRVSDLSQVEQQLLREGIRAYASIPLFAESDFIGSLSLGSDQPGAFDREHIEIAYQVADMLAISIRQAQLVEKLNRANVELQAALQAKEEMIQNVSHELRSPLALMSGYAELLNSGDLGPLTTEQKQAVQIICDRGEKLHFMMERLLTLKAFEAANLKRVPMNVGAWLKHTLQAWAVRASAAGIRLELEVPDSLPPLPADPDYLDQVITNLLHNAVKFSPDGGAVRVRAQAEGSQVVIAVSDEGIGMSPDQLKTVFERFYQADGSATRRFGGVGIGLALCDLIVQAHGGHIWAESAGEGQGSTFAFALPLTDSAERDGWAKPGSTEAAISETVSCLNTTHSNGERSETCADRGWKSANWGS